MRQRSPIAAAALFVSILAAAPVLQAQGMYGPDNTRLFQNAWFWGVHAGATTIGTPARSTGTAATFGAEWFLTRTDGGLYVAYDQANFSGTSSLVDNSTATGVRPVSIRNLRTGTIAALAFPFQAHGFRPYAGVGFALTSLGSASPQSVQGDTVSADIRSSAEDARSRFGVVGLGGLQYQIRRTAIFGQASIMPGDNAFLVTRPIAAFTAGVRYNFGSDIER